MLMKSSEAYPGAEPQVFNALSEPGGNRVIFLTSCVAAETPVSEVLQTIMLVQILCEVLSEALVQKRSFKLARLNLKSAHGKRSLRLANHSAV